jgi:parallel beta-helix repeat protein
MGSNGPGIILINSGRCKIVRNDITGNKEGVTMRQSLAEIRRNYISDNKNNGIVCEESSQPKMLENFITRNHSIGTFLRDQSGGNVSRGTHSSIIHSNIIVNNEI